MKKTLIFSVAAVGCLFSLLFINPAKAFDGGTGTAEDPYLVSIWDDLDVVRGGLSDHYKLVNDLIDSTKGYTGVGDNWQPIGSSTSPFTGTFDGNGHIISDLIIDSPTADYIGLFGNIGSTGAINRLGVVDVEISGRDFVGALVGFNQGKISQTYTSGSVSGRDSVGGLAGGNSGWSGTWINNSYSTASVSANQTAGSHGSRIGGFTGGTGSPIYSSYSMGAVTQGSATNSAYILGFLGTDHDGGVMDSFWNTETSGQASSAGGSGVMSMDTAEMGVTSTFTDVLWDFGDDNNAGIWIMYEGRPHLRWEPIFSATDAIVEIHNCLQLQAIKDNLAGKYYLATDINCYSDTNSGGALNDDGNGFDPIGDIAKPFRGVFNGGGHRISGLYSNRGDDDPVGVFGFVDTTGIVENVGVVNATIIGDSASGVLVGHNNGTILKSYSAGSVVGSNQAGGLVGINQGSIENSYSLADVEGDDTGGLVGENGGTIVDSFSIGSVSGTGSRGGLVATTTAVKSSLVEDSFWDTEASGIGSSAAGTGKTTAQMKVGSTFIDAGWDINGVWGIDGSPEKNDGYAYLIWQAPYVIDYQVEGNGSIDGPTTQRVGEGITPESVEAVPDEHYEFVSWSDGNENPERLEQNVYGNVLATANFAINPSTTFALIYTAGTGGTVTGDVDQTINYNSDGSTVTAVPNSGYRFVRWSDNSTANPRTDTAVAKDISVSAVFERIHSSGGSSSIPVPTAVGTGNVNQTVGMGQSGNIGAINTQGTNYFSYVNSNAGFNAVTSRSGSSESHQIIVNNLDLSAKTIQLTIQSTPQEISLKLGEAVQVDLDGDKIKDIEIKFANLLVNQAELTMKSLLSISGAKAETVVTAPVKTSDTPKTTTVKTTPVKAAVQYIFKRSLSIGMTGVDVKELQKFLNAKGFIIAKSGSGSKGKETASFGSLTKAALIKFQKANKIQPASGLFGPLTRNAVNKAK